MKLIAADDSSDAYLLGDIAEAGDEHHGDALFFDLSADRSAATRARASRRGQDHTVDTGAGELFRNA
jgi:hypothetical protein